MSSDTVREPMEINNRREIDNEVIQTSEIREDTRVHRELTRIGAVPKGFIANIAVHNRVRICGMRWLRHVGETIIRAAGCGGSTGANSARLSMRYTLMTLRAIGEWGELGTEPPRLLTHFRLCERLQLRCGHRRIWCSNFAVLPQYKNFAGLAIRPFAHTNPLNPIGFHVRTDVRPSVDANSFCGWGSFKLTLKLESAILCPGRKKKVDSTLPRTMEVTSTWKNWRRVFRSHLEA